MNKNLKFFLLCICLMVMLYSVYQLISYYTESNEAQAVYENIYEQFIISTEQKYDIVEETIEETKEVEDGTIIKTYRTVYRDKLTDIIYEENPIKSTEVANTENTNNSPVDINALISAYPDVKGWIYGQGGYVNYPVTQSTNNNYYLNHLIDGTYNTAGTIMIDCNNTFPEDNIIWIYGHKRKDLTMFGRFYSYDSYEYYKQYPHFYLYTKDKTYKLEIIGAFYASPLDHYKYGYANEDEFNDYIDYIKRNSPYIGIEPEYGDILVVLQCCAWHIENGRYRIVCRLV